MPWNPNWGAIRFDPASSVEVSVEACVSVRSAE